MMMTMNKTFAAAFLLLIFSVCAFSQTKSISEAETEIKTFKNSANFSVTYDDPKDLTTAKVLLDIRENTEALQKPFKKFDWEITSIFSGIEIDGKPVRNVLCINTQSKKPNFASGNTLLILLENEEVNFGEANRFSEVKGGKVEERMCWDISKEIIEDFAEVENMNFQIGSIKSSVSINLLQFFRDYAKLLKLDNE